MTAEVDEASRRIESLGAWRVRVLTTIMRAMLGLGVLALVASTVVNLADGQVVLAIAYWIALAAFAVATLKRGLSHTARLGALVVLVYAVALGIVLGEQRLPEFAVYMFALPALAALLGGIRWGVGVLLLCSATIIGVAVLAVRGNLPPGPPDASNIESLGNWMTFGANWGLLAIGTCVSVWFVVSRLDESLVRAKALADDLERQVEARKAAQAQLVHAQKMEALGHLAGGVAHDFNNLLTAIMFGSEDALGRASSIEDRSSLTMVRDAARQAETLTRQLLALSRRQVAQPRLVLVRAVVDDLIRVIRRLVPSNIRVEATHELTTEGVFMDEMQLRQVLINLAVNARDAMPGGGELRFLTYRHDGDVDGARGARLPSDRYAVVEVRDTGPGIPESDREDVFEPFFTKKPEGKGTGLGLSTSLQITEEAGGVLQVDDAPDGGAALRLFLPVSDAVPGPSPTPPASPELPPGLRVLVVDDDVIVRALVVSALREGGAAIREYDSVEAALADETNLDDVDVLITDVVLPGRSGPDLVQAMRRRHPETPLVYCSGCSPDDRVRAEVKAGDAHFLPKPFSRTDLLYTVAHAVAPSRNATG